MWSDIDDRAPIVAITNGVHLDTWMHPSIRRAYMSNLGLWNAHMKPNRALQTIRERRTAPSSWPWVCPSGRFV